MVNDGKNRANEISENQLFFSRKVQGFIAKTIFAPTAYPPSGKTAFFWIRHFQYHKWKKRINICREKL